MMLEDIIFWMIVVGFILGVIAFLLPRTGNEVEL